MVGIEQDASGQAKPKLARTGTNAVKQLHVLAAASLAGFEVITDGRFCGDHRGTANRWGSERGYCVVMGQKVPIERPRVRSEEQEVRLGSYELFHRGEPLTETVWEKLMLGLSTRKYGEAVRQFTEAYGLEKSAVSEHFIEASRAKLQAVMERRLEKIQFCALMIDATPFAGQQLVAVLGITVDGKKMILGIRQGATENATVVGELLGDLLNRGLDFTIPRLYVLDGGKALTAAVKKYAGESAPIQRCQVHKRRNVLDHLTEERKPGETMIRACQGKTELPLHSEVFPEAPQ